MTFWDKLKSVTPDTWARTICLLLALVNQCLATFGKGALPFTDDQVYQIVSLIATIVTGAIAWWKNNSFTQNAIAADKMRKETSNNK